MRKNNKAVKNILKIVIPIIVFVILISITSFIIGDDKELNFFEKAIKDSSTCIQKIFYAPVKLVKEKIDEHQDKKDLYKKYVQAKKQAEKSELYYAQIKELQKEVADLKDTLSLNSTLSEYTYVNATVVNRNVGYWYDLLTVDKGLLSGVKEGDAVITNSGLIGKIVSVGNFSSSVRLLTTEEIINKISIKIEHNDKLYYGLLSGYDKEKNVYRIEGITSTSIKEGDIVTTTGLTDYFPSGILIGKVSSIIKDEYDLNSIVEVIPSVDFKNISIVTILNRKALE